AGHRRLHVHARLVDGDLGDQLSCGHRRPVRRVPGRHHTFRVGVVGIDGGEDDRGHVAITCRTAAVMRAGVGKTAYSSTCAYGIGTSGTATRAGALRSADGSCSTTVAITSPESPKER